MSISAKEWLYALVPVCWALEQCYLVWIQDLTVWDKKFTLFISVTMRAVGMNRYFFSPFFPFPFLFQFLFIFRFLFSISLSSSFSSFSYRALSVDSFSGKDFNLKNESLHHYRLPETAFCVWKIESWSRYYITVDDNERNMGRIRGGRTLCIQIPQAVLKIVSMFISECQWLKFLLTRIFLLNITPGIARTVTGIS